MAGCVLVIAQPRVADRTHVEPLPSPAAQRHGREREHRAPGRREHPRPGGPFDQGERWPTFAVVSPLLVVPRGGAMYGGFMASS